MSADCEALLPARATPCWTAPCQSCDVLPNLQIDEILKEALQADCTKYAPGIDIISVRVTKPRLPAAIVANYEVIPACPPLRSPRHGFYLSSKPKLQRYLQLVCRFFAMQACVSTRSKSHARYISEASLLGQAMEAERTRVNVARERAVVVHQEAQTEHKRAVMMVRPSTLPVISTCN